MAPARKVPKLHKKTVDLAEGTRFVDTQKQEFVIGKEIGQGGFGRIYEGKQAGTKLAVAIKVEPHDNGPLFTETHVYQRILKADHLAAWKAEKGIKFLGLPHYISSGDFLHDGTKIRFLVIPRFGCSLESVRESRSAAASKEGGGGFFTTTETLTISRSVLYSLAYMHDQNYVHGDVKAANLMLPSRTDFTKPVLIDFGLARRLPDALVEKENKKQAHNGTALFTSCDAHRGCLPSFRGDLEILAHNMLYWMTGNLPWQHCEQDPEQVYQLKKQLLPNVRRELPKLVKCRKGAAVLIELYTVAGQMDFSAKLDVDRLAKLLMASSGGGGAEDSDKATGSSSTSPGRTHRPPQQPAAGTTAGRRKVATPAAAAAAVAGGSGGIGTTAAKAAANGIAAPGDKMMAATTSSSSSRCGRSGAATRSGRVPTGSRSAATQTSP